MAFDKLPVGFKTLLTSHDKGWQKLQLNTYKTLTEQPITVSMQVYTLQVVLEGKGTLQGDFAGRSVQAPLRAGSLSLLSPAMPVTLNWVEPGAIAHVQLPTELLLEFSTLFKQSSLELLPLPYFHDPLIEHLVMALIAELETLSPLGASYADTLGQALVVHLLRHYSSLNGPPKIGTKGLSLQQLEQIDEFIDKFLASEIRCRDLASVVGLHPTKFTRYFKDLTGLPPHQYLIRRRIEKAKGLLAKGVTSVAEVAHMVGFFDQSHLVRHFRTKVGVTPKDFNVSSLDSRA